MNSKFDSTINAYKKLGSQYIKNIADYTPVEFEEFTRLIRPKGKVLDIGCCGGRDSRKLVNKGFDVVGIDLLDTFLEEAKKNVPEAQFIKKDVRNLDFPKDFFDAIWANAVLLHCEKGDIPKIFSNFYRILKTGGLLHIRVKEGKGLGIKVDEIAGKEKRLFTFFTKDELKAMLENTGFEIIKLRLFPDESGRPDIKWISIWSKKN